MSLRRREQRQLQLTDRAVSRSDPQLAGMLAVFSRVAADEPMPCHEELRTLANGMPGRMRPAAAAIRFLIARIGAVVQSTGVAAILGTADLAADPRHASDVHPVFRVPGAACPAPATKKTQGGHSMTPRKRPSPLPPDPSTAADNSPLPSNPHSDRIGSPLSPHPDPDRRSSPLPRNPRSDACGSPLPPDPTPAPIIEPSERPTSR